MKVEGLTSNSKCVFVFGGGGGGGVEGGRGKGEGKGVSLKVLRDYTSNNKNFMKYSLSLQMQDFTESRQVSGFQGSYTGLPRLSRVN